MRGRQWLRAFLRGPLTRRASRVDPGSSPGQALSPQAGRGEAAMFSAELFVQTLIAGVVIGVLYALMALGITFIYSIVKMINWSMGEFYMIGSYLQYLLVVEWLGPDLWWVAAPLSALGVFALGFLLEPLLIKPMFTQAIERKDDYAIVVTIALLLLLRNLATALSGPYQRTPGSNLPTVMLGPLPERGARLAAFVCALAAM